MMRIVYFIKYLLQGILVALGMTLAIYIGVTYIWGIPLLLGLLLTFTFIAYCWEKACTEYEEKRGNKSYAHPELEHIEAEIKALKESESE